MSENNGKNNGICLVGADLEKIVSPVTLIFPDRSKKSYKNGIELAAAALDHPYTIKSIAAVDDEIGMILEEPEA